jgi:hypothetical protein
MHAARRSGPSYLNTPPPPSFLVGLIKPLNLPFLHSCRGSHRRKCSPGKFGLPLRLRRTQTGSLHLYKYKVLKFFNIDETAGKGEF